MTASSPPNPATDSAAASPGRPDTRATPAERQASLRAAFAGRLLTDAAEMTPFLVDYRRRWYGQALAVALPDTARDVAAVVRWCREYDHAVVPQGGNTGLTGASVPSETRPTVLLSLKRLNRVRSVDPIGNTMVVEAGCVLQQVQEAAEARGRLFPLSLAAEGSCTIGGNLATNAGGVQVIRYGNMRELCLGLEVVTAEGELWDGLYALRKNNTGYDLRDLFIGSEGTLGIITAAVLKLFPRPVARVAAFVAVAGPADALRFLAHAQTRLGSELTAFELISDEAMTLVLQHIEGSRLPLATRSPWYLLVEVSSLHDESRAMAAMESMLVEALDETLIVDAVVSASIDQFRRFWALRERISEAQSAIGRNVKHDISVPIARIGEFIEAARASIQAVFPAASLIVFGHLGDGNLHFNVAPTGQQAARYDQAFEEMEARVNRLTHDAVLAHGGSISAEHGIGVLRRDELPRCKSALELRMMRAIKAALDPDDRMNPGKILHPRHPG
ncbi:MAG: FAD-binding oxidoreductase [Lautropia sp.]|nr:FAD-binding oxidoreductase [Lautropia sp.]